LPPAQAPAAPAPQAAPVDKTGLITEFRYQIMMVSVLAGPPYPITEHLLGLCQTALSRAVYRCGISGEDVFSHYLIHLLKSEP
jgi:hypothetical protein